MGQSFLLAAGSKSSFFRACLLVLGLLTFLGLGGVATQASEGAHVELILDASGSMWNKLDDGRFRISAAKSVLGDFVEGLPEAGLDVGLRVYGSKVAAKEEGSCLDSELLVPISGVDKTTLDAVIQGSRAIGATPIALSLERAVEDFPADASRKVIVLVTDGEEACDGDVRRAAENVRNQGIELRIVGFDLDAKAIAGFDSVGSFENAADAKELASALGRAVEAVVPALSGASLEAPDTVQGGHSFEVSWKGEDGKGDYVTLVPIDAEEGSYGSWRYTSAGNPLKLTAPFDPGSYELRYQSDRVGGVAGRRPIQVVESEVALAAPATVPAGTSLEVEWRGPDDARDYITLVPHDAPAGAYKSYFYTNSGSPGTLLVPFDAGRYEVRYQTERPTDRNKIFASVEVEVLPLEILLDAPAKAMAGSRVEVRWAGPDGKGDYVTVVDASAPDGKYGAYFYTASGNPGVLQIPSTPGDYEFRYMSDREGGRVFGRIPLKAEPAIVQLMAPPRVKAGDKLPVKWLGPDGQYDYLTIVAEGAEPGTYGAYVYLKSGNPLQIAAPAEPGRYEIRYQTDRGPDKGKVFGAVPLVVE